MGLSLRNLVAIGVLLAWGGSIAWLVVRRNSQSQSAFLRSEASLRLGPGDAWFQVMAGDTPIGIAGITLDTLDSGYRIRETVTLDRPRGQALERANRTTEYLMGPDLSLIRLASRDGILGFRRLLILAADQDGWTATVQHDERVVASGRVAGPLPTAVLLAPYRLALTGALASGDSRTMTGLGGWPPSAAPAQYTVTGDTLVVFADSSELRDPLVGWQAVHYDSAASRTVVIMAASGPLVVQVDRRGTLTGLRYPLGFRWVRTDFDLAHRDLPKDRQADAADRVRAQLPVIRRWAGSRLAARPRLDSITYRVTRRDGTRIGGSLLRHFAGDGVSYRAAREAGVPNGDLLHVGRPDPRRRPDQEPVLDPLIQADNARIVAFADSFVSDSGDVDFDELRNRFARLSVDTGAVAPVDAVGTLEAGGGSPDGVARLLTAILRSHGGRARFAIGVAAMADTLYSHAWVERWSASEHRWTAIDPLTLRPASARLIRLAYAGSSHPEDILRLVADVRLVPVDSIGPERPEGTPP